MLLNLRVMFVFLTSAIQRIKMVEMIADQSFLLHFIQFKKKGLEMKMCE